MSKNSIWVSHVDMKNSSTWTITCCLPGMLRGGFQLMSSLELCAIGGSSMFLLLCIYLNENMNYGAYDDEFVVQGASDMSG